MTRLSALVLPLLLAACAQNDPYKRLAPAPAGDISGAHEAINLRWPAQFKAVQTVTIDFHIATRSLVGYLLVQQPGRFRLQGMTEQGIKLFDIVGTPQSTRVVFSAEDFDARVIENIARDIRRVFLLQTSDVGSRVRYRSTLGDVGDVAIAVPVTELARDPGGSTIEFRGRHGQLRARLVGDPSRLDWYAFRRDDRDLYRIDSYEWAQLGAEFVPTTIVLRELGVQSRGPAYKLTIKLNELTVRDEPWPDAVFDPE